MNSQPFFWLEVYNNNIQPLYMCSPLKYRLENRSIDEFNFKVTIFHINHSFSLGNTTALSLNHLHVTLLRPDF